VVGVLGALLARMVVVVVAAEVAPKYLTELLHSAFPLV